MRNEKIRRSTNHIRPIFVEQSASEISQKDRQTFPVKRITWTKERKKDPVFLTVQKKTDIGADMDKTVRKI